MILEQEIVSKCCRCYKVKTLFAASALLLLFHPSTTHLWRHKVGGVTGGEKQAVAPPELLGKAKVTDPDGVGVPRVIHVQDVAGFQVSVNHLWSTEKRNLLRKGRD